MDIGDELRSETLPRPSTGLPPIAGLTAELQELVEQLEADWLNHRMIVRKASDDLHDLRMRAERLLSSAT